MQANRTKSANSKDGTIQSEWLVIDAADKVVGRLATRTAALLRGKHKPYYTPHVDCGDHVVIINAAKVRFTGKKEDKKIYLSYSGYPGGQKAITPKALRTRFPERIIEKAVKGMLPKNKLGRQIYKKLSVYAGEEHPHQAQQPTLTN